MTNDKKKGLGKGFNGYSNLLGDPDVENDDTTATLSITKVQPGLNQPRKKFEPEAISELADSIRTHGIIQPLTVRKLDSGYYEIVAGERRWRAAKEVGLLEIPVLIIEADDRKVMEIGLIENLQREDLNPVEEARGYQVLMEDYNLTQEQVAERMGKSRPAIANALRLLGLTDKILDMVADGTISAGHGRTLLSAPNERMMEEVAELILKHDLSVRRTEETIKAMKKVLDQPEKSLVEEDEIYIYVRESQENLTQSMGRRVQIQHNGKRGKIVMEYTDAHDLTDLVEVLTSLQEDNHGGA